MLKHVSLVTMPFGILLSFQCYAMDGVQVMHPERPPLERTQSMLVLRLVPAHSITDFRKQLEVEQRKQKHAEQEQLVRNRMFHEAAGLGTGANPLRSYSDEVVKQQFAVARKLLEQGAQITWGHPLLNLLLAFKLREEQHYSQRTSHCASFPYAGYTTTTVATGYGRVQKPTIFGEGHAFFAWLVQNGADVNDVWKEDDTERFKHYEMGHSEKYERTSDVRNKTSNHSIPLKYALELCKEGCCVKALLDAHAKPYPAALADAMRFNPAVAQTLVQKGASVVEVDEKGNNAVHWALSAQLPCEERIALLETLHTAKANFHAVNKNKQTPLHTAVVHDNYHTTLHDDVAALAWLLEHEPLLVDAQDHTNQTALYVVIAGESMFYRSQWRENSQEYFFSHTPRKEPEIRALLWKTHAQKDLFAQNTTLAQMLLKGGANPAIAAKGGVTPLHKAAERGMQDCVTLLLEYKAPVDAKTDTGLTPLHCVILSDIPLAAKTAIVKQLMDAGASIDMGDQEGNTALHKAAQVAAKDEIALLLAFGARFDTRNLRNESPLELYKKSASYFGATDKVEKLFKKYKEGKRISHFDPIQKKVVINADTVSFSE